MHNNSVFLLLDGYTNEVAEHRVTRAEADLVIVTESSIFKLV